MFRDDNPLTRHKDLHTDQARSLNIRSTSPSPTYKHLYTETSTQTQCENK